MRLVQLLVIVAEEQHDAKHKSPAEVEYRFNFEVNGLISVAFPRKNALPTLEMADSFGYEIRSLLAHLADKTLATSTRSSRTDFDFSTYTMKNQNAEKLFRCVLEFDRRLRFDVLAFAKLLQFIKTDRAVDYFSFDSLDISDLSDLVDKAYISTIRKV